MFVTRKTRRRNRLDNVLFLFLFLGVVGLLAWLSTRYSFEADWTANGRNTLSEASTSLLAELNEPVTITSYATEDGSVRQAVSELVGKYQRYKSDLTLNFVNPDLEPNKVRDLGITINGELVVQYQGRSENLKNLSEQGLTNSLQRLARSGERWLVFVEGHGERKPRGVANHDFGQWSQQLVSKGFKIQTHNLVQNPQLPENTRVLVIAGPQLNYLPGEVAIIQQYLNAGGNLLWLSDPADDDKNKIAQHGLMPLATQLGISFQPGMIVDPTTQVLGVSDPRFALVADYPKHIISQNIDALTLFPQAHGLIFTASQNWDGQRLLMTEPRSWSETGKLSGALQFDAKSDISGPLTLGMALSRTPASTEADTTKSSEPAAQSATQSTKEQRVVVIGDGDFLANAYLGNGANLSLGMNIINWLAHDDNLIHIPARLATDRQLELSPIAQGIIGIGFLFVLPLLLSGTGFMIWWQRRKR